MNSPEKAKKTCRERAGKRKSPKGLSGLNLKDQSQQARRTTAIVLAVLAGESNPKDAAASLGVSINQYYLLEKRALQGILSACEPRPKGPVPSADKEVERLSKEIKRLEQELLRQQALTRTTQRAVGLTLPRSGKARDKRTPSGKKCRKRKPTVRALTLASRLQAPESEVESRPEGPSSPEEKGS